MTRSEAGRLGGKATLKKHGHSHFSRIGKKGAAVFHRRYVLVPINMNDFAICYRDSGKPTGKTLNGKVLGG